MSVCGIVVAAGKGTRMGTGFNKVYMPLLGKCILWHTIKAMYDSRIFDELVIVTGSDDITKCKEISSEFNIPVKVCEGGATRQESVMRGLAASECDMAAVHDGARALVLPDIIRAAVFAAQKYGAAAVGVIPKDTVKLSKKGFISSTVRRENAVLIQTPQVFSRLALFEEHIRAEKDGFIATDDCMIMERAGVQIKITEGSYENIKITTPEDIFVAERILTERSKN